MPISTSFTIGLCLWLTDLAPNASVRDLHRILRGTT